MDDNGVHYCIKCNSSFIGLNAYITHRQNKCTRKHSDETVPTHQRESNACEDNVSPTQIFVARNSKEEMVKEEDNDISQSTQSDDNMNSVPESDTESTICATSSLATNSSQITYELSTTIPKSGVARLPDSIKIISLTTEEPDEKDNEIDKVSRKDVLMNDFSLDGDMTDSCLDDEMNGEGDSKDINLPRQCIENYAGKFSSDIEYEAEDSKDEHGHSDYEEESARRKKDGKRQEDPDFEMDTEDEDDESIGSAEENVGKRIILEDEEFHCVSCNKGFSSQIALNRHNSSAIHKKQQKILQPRARTPSLSNFGEQQTQPLNVQEQQRQHQCPHCMESYNRRVDLLNHLSMKIKQQKNIYESLPRDLQKDVNKFRDFQCHICEYFTDFSQEFDEHMSTETHREKYSSAIAGKLCVHCRYSCNTPEEMNAHLRTDEHKKKVVKSIQPNYFEEHNVEEQRAIVKCKDCDMEFSSVKQMQRHWNATHVPQRLVKKKQVASNRNRDSESAFRRPGEKPWRCNKCKVSFRNSSEWRRHRRGPDHNERNEETKPRSDEEKALSSDVHLDGGTYTEFLPHKTETETRSDETKASSSAVHLDGGTYTEFLPHETVLFIKENLVEGRKGYKCHMAGCQFTTRMMRSFYKHYRRKHDPKYHCKVCNYSTIRRDIFKHHLSNPHHNLLMQDVVDENLSRTMEINDKQKSDQRILAHNVSKSQLDSSNPHKVFICPECSVPFKNESSLSIHRLIHMIFSEEQICDGDELKYTADKHHQFVKSLQSNREVDVNCPECSRSMKRSSIIAHLRLHSNIRPFTCVFCKKAYHSGSTGLRPHVYKCHMPPKPKPKKCTHCTMRFSSIRSLNKHVFHRHRENVFKPRFICNVCSKEFSKSSLYRVHLNSHKKVKQFPCPYPKCSQSFRSSYERSKHRRIHLTEKPFLCDVCGFSTWFEKNLQRHKQIHSADMFKCGHCTYRTHSVDNLAYHLRTLCYSRVFQCPHCDFKASQLSSLRRHALRTKKHPGLKLLKCHLCDSKFNYVNEMVEHLGCSHKLLKTKSEVLELTGIFNKSLDSDNTVEKFLETETDEAQSKIVI